MRGRTPRIRHQLSPDVTLGEQFRDAQGSLDAIPSTVLRKLEMVYTEPMVLGGFDRQPEGIEAMRVLDMGAQETPLLAGGLCHFVWRPDKGGAHVTSVDGMSIAANGGKKYRFTFRFTFAPVGASMASTDQKYEAYKADLSKRLFGSPIAVGNMTAQQRKVFQETANKELKSSSAGFSGPDYIERLDNEIKTEPLPGSRPTDYSSSLRADTFNQLNTQNTASAAERQRLLDALQGETNVANQTDRNALGSLTTSQDQASQRYNNIAQQQRTTANDYNNLSAGLFGSYAQGQGALNAQDQASYGQYMTDTQPLMQQLQARGSNPADVQRQLDSYNLASGIAGGSLNYTAAQYASNPQDIARQESAYNALAGAGAGSLDYTAAQYQSNPGDVARQLQGYNDLRAIGQGSLDYKSQAALAEANPRYVHNQERALEDIRGDLENGSKDQREVMNKFKALSNPEVTSQERFLSELARREFETRDKSSRDAVSANLAARGLRSGGQQIAGQQADRQQIAQDRLLKELGIQAQAVDRSMQALGGWGTAANSIRSGDQNALNMQAGLTTSMRNASFDEAYKRGVGADNASANNQGTRLAGTQGSAQQATNIRNASDAVGTFNTGQTNQARANNQATRLGGMQGAATQSNAIRSANDYVGTFNVGQTNTARANNQQTQLSGAGMQIQQSNAIRGANDSVSQFQDIYAQNEAGRVGNLAGQRAQTGLQTTAQQGGRQTDVFNAGQNTIDKGYSRTTDANNADWAATGQDLGIAGNYFDATTNTADRRVGRAQDTLNTTSNIRAQDSADLARALGLRNQGQAIDEERNLVGA